MNLSKSLLLTLFVICLIPLRTIQAQSGDEVASLYLRFRQAIDKEQLDSLQAIDATCTALSKKTRPGTKQDALIVLMQGRIAYESGHYTVADSESSQALALCRQYFGENATETLDAKKTLGFTCGYLGKKDLEHQYYLELLDYYKRNQTKYALEISDMYNTMAQSFGYIDTDWTTEQIYLDSARNFLEKFKPVTAEQRSQQSQIKKNLYNSLAISFLQSNNYENALICGRQGLSIGAGEEHYYDAPTWMAISRSMFEMGENPDSCLYRLRKAITLVDNDQTRPQWLIYRAYKADMLLKAKRTEQSLTETVAALSYCQKRKNLDPISAVALMQLCIIGSKAYLKMGDYEKALSLCTQTKASCKNIQGVPRSLHISLNTQYAVVLAKSSRWAAAEQEFESAIAETGISLNQLSTDPYSIPEIVPYQYLLLYKQAGNCFAEMGIATHNKMNVAKGIKILNKVADGLQRGRAWQFEAGVDDGLGAQEFGIYEDLLQNLYNARGFIDEPLRLANAFDAIESSKSALLKNNLLQEQFFNKTLPAAVRQKQTALRASFYAAWKFYRDTGNASNEAGFLERRKSYLENLREIKSKYGFNKIQQTNLAHYNDSLFTQHKGAIVNYFQGDEGLYLFIHQNGTQQFIRKNIPENFQDDLAFVRKKGVVKGNWNNPKDSATLSMTLKKWYQWLLGDIDVRGELIIVPHRELSEISFEMLDCSENPQQINYLINKVPVRYVLSASIMQLAKSQQRATSEKLFGGFSAADFTSIASNTGSQRGPSPDAARSGLQSLPGTWKEVKEIAENWSGDIYEHTHPDDFIQNAYRYKILHIATHAFSDRGPSHECVLVFEPDRAGKYMVRDIQIDSLRLNADMAVLSACNTATGKLNKNEGMLSLGRSFFIAGCPSVVMSLWSVNDESTTRIMSLFYHFLRQGLDKSTALRNAQQEYVKTETGSKTHPYYWAGFIIVGDNAPISFDQNNHRWHPWFLAGLSIAVLAILILAMVKSRRPAVKTGQP